MIRKWILPLLAVLAPVVVTGTAMAGGSPVSEVRGGIMAHSVDEGGTLDFLNLTRIEDLNLEVLFNPTDLAWLGDPRPTLGTTINFAGLESQVYAGLTWHAQLFDSPVFLEGVFGGAFNDGHIRGAVYPARNLGSHILFHEAVSLGYNFSEHMNAMLTLEHSSNASLLKPNRGLTELGLRFGYKF